MSRFSVGLKIMVCAVIAFGLTSASLANDPLIPEDCVKLSWDSAKAMKANKKPIKLNRKKNAFDKNTDSARTPGKTMIEWTIPENFKSGEYYLAVPMSNKYFLGFNEFLAPRTSLSHNDHRLPWTSHTIPRKRSDLKKPAQNYQALMRCDVPVQVKAGDIIRLNNRFWLTSGPLLLSSKPWKTSNAIALPKTSPATPNAPALPVMVSFMPQEMTDSELKQKFVMINQASLPKKIKLNVLVQDYWRRVLINDNAELVLEPGKAIEKEYSFKRSDTRRDSLQIKITCEGYTQKDWIKFYLNDLETGPRRRWGLNGEWEYAFVDGSEFGEKPSENAKWTKIVLPSYLPQHKGHCAWLRKKFTPPDFIKGQRYILKLDSANYESTFYLNGEKIHYQKYGTQPFEVDLTKAFIPGKPNELLIALRDWLAYSPENRKRLAENKPLLVREDIKYPVGHGVKWKGFGLTGLIYLETRPDVFVDDVFIVTSVREKKMKLKYRIKNQNSAKQKITVEPIVLDRGKAKLTLAAKTIEIAPGEAKDLFIESDWTDPTLWEPGKPYLYILKSDLKVNDVAGDSEIQRFGFREVWIEGINIVVNGKPMKIRSQWNKGAHGSPGRRKYKDPSKRLAATWEWQRKCMFERSTQLSRTHNMTGVEELCDMADETGLMLKIEDGNVCQIKFSFDQEYWDNILKDEVNMIDAYKNHASVFMWSAGNENIWCFGYKGEKVRQFAFKEMAKIADAMEDFDLMRRPVEWEADGDLNGHMKYHNLHYFRELDKDASVLPVDTWLGDMNAKPTLNYAICPIKLGEKPITIGEAFWPRVPIILLATTLLNGDESYKGGWFWMKGWIDSSQYIINGLRDSEAALLDVYTPLCMMTPQTIVIKEKNNAFYSGKTIVRNINIHNDIREDANLAFRWTLKNPETKAVLSSGDDKLAMKPAGLKRLQVKLSLPEVKSETPLVFSTGLFDGEKLVHSESQFLRVFPEIKIAIPADSGIQVYDPNGKTTPVLSHFKVPFTKLDSLAASLAKRLIIGKNAFEKEIDDKEVENLRKMVRDGGKILIFQQQKFPEFLLPFSTRMKYGGRSSITFIKTPEHPVMKGISKEDMRWWGEDHLVSRNNFAKPFNGNWLPLADAGSTGGTVETPLFEEYYGNGSFILSQYDIAEKCLEAPPAALILKNLLTYLTQNDCFRKLSEIALIAAPDSALRKTVKINNIVCEDLAEDASKLTFPTHKGALVELCSGIKDEGIAKIKEFVNAGGNVMLYQITPENGEIVKKLTGASLILLPLENEGDDVKNRVLRIGDQGMLAGVSNHDLLWGSSRYHATINGHNGRWWSYLKGIKKDEFIANYFCYPSETSPSGARELTMPCALLELPLGKGRFIVNQLKLDSPDSNAKVSARRLASILFTNFGARIKSSGQFTKTRQKRLDTYEFKTIDLGLIANRGVKDIPEKKILGWTNQGENDMRDLKTGKQTLVGVPFFISSPKSAVVLHSKSGKGNLELPKKVNIPVQGKGDSVFFLHSTAWSKFPVPIQYKINYSDGSSKLISMKNGENVVDWWGDPAKYAESMAMNNTILAFRGQNPINSKLGFGGVSIYCYEWPNPNPDKEIQSIDFMTVPASGYAPVSVLAGITLGKKSASKIAAAKLPEKGVFVSPIGTSGVKVKSGDKVYDIYYIGAVGLDKSHPYYAEALAEHVKIASNPNVKIKYSSIKKDEQGRLLAYVFAEDTDDNIKNSYNNKMVGSGLAKPGNFHGNGEHQAYFENLGFISKSNNTGLWKHEKK